MEYFQISRRQLTKTCGIARSTLYRWLKSIDDIPNSTQHPWNKTPEALTAMVWRISKDNIDWGRVRISNQLKILNIFLAASTVRNIFREPNQEIHEYPGSTTPALAFQNKLVPLVSKNAKDVPIDLEIKRIDEM
jgi:hypothetical protein